jgi:hypothetical protein
LAFTPTGFLFLETPSPQRIGRQSGDTRNCFRFLDRLDPPPFVRWFSILRMAERQAVKTRRSILSVTRSAFLRNLDKTKGYRLTDRGRNCVPVNAESDEVGIGTW